MTTKQLKTGWIGLGAMGQLMAQNMIKAGYELTVYNRTRSKEKPLVEVGAKTASSPAEVTENSDVIFLMVSDDQATEEVFTGAGGVLSSEVSGKIIVNMSTVSADISKKMAAKCLEEGHHYLDAPVSGSIKQATDATLVIIAGGEQIVFEKVKPMLEILGKKAFLMGDIGAGNKTKLAVNTYLAIMTQGLAEVALFAKQMGIDQETFLNVIGTGGLSSPYSSAKSKSIINNQYPPAFALKHMAKDLRLAVDENLDSPLGKAAYRSYQKAEETLGDKDVMAVIKSLSEA